MKKFSVFDMVELISTGQVGKIVMLIGRNERQEAYVDMRPGVAPGYDYEYVEMWDENEGQVELRALNKFPIKDIKPYFGE